MAKVGIIQYDTTPVNNSDINSIAVSENCAIANLNNAIRQAMADQVQRLGSAVSVTCSATGMAIGDQEEEVINVTGSTGPVTSLGTPAVANKFGYWLVFASTPTITHNATSNILQGGADYTMSAGDIAYVRHEGSGNWRWIIFPKSGNGPAWHQGATVTPATGDLLALQDVSNSNKTAFATVSSVVALATGKFVNRYYATEYTSNTNLTTTIPLDDTTPTSTEGTSILSVSVTTTTTTQSVRLRFEGLAAGDGSNTIIWALFRDTTCVLARSNSGGDIYAGTWQGNIGLEYEDAPGAAGTYSYSIRVGGNTGTIRMNGDLAGRYFGGASKCTLVADVIEP